MGRPRPAVGGSHSHSLDSVPSPGLGQRKYLCIGVPKGVYSERLLGAKTEIPAYTLLHMVMDVNRQQPDKDHRPPNTHPQTVVDAYSAIVRQIFEVPERLVVRDELDLEVINKSLEAIFARRQFYCPDEPHPAA